MKKYALPLLLIIIAGTLPARFLFGYLSSYQYSLHKREELARKDTGDINIAVTWNLPFLGANFKRGAELALEEENERGFTFTKDDVLIQKKMVLHEFYDVSNDNNRMTEDIVSDPNIIAVLSISESNQAISSSVSYEQHGILSISTFATDQHLTNHGFKYVFSILPTSREYAQALVNFCDIKGYKNIAVLYSRQGMGGLNLAINFSGLLKNKDTNVIFSHSLDPKQKDYRQLIYDLQQHPFDAILLGAKGEIAGRVINQLREMGVNKPLFSGISMDDTALWELSGKRSNNVFVASIYDDTEKSEDRKSDAYRKFYKKYGYPPNFAARQGYDGLKIIAAAIRKSNSIVPIDIAGTLKYNFKNELGNNYFDNLGRIANKKLFIKEMKNGEFYNVLKPE
ncbi:ABC transporter substrate-binding protein [Methylobacter sp.]|uniref:ABC transporter substrate-binding protein n=1 Tax=Methylobacter sp. TaxID=2051955 RepID=UPI002FDD2D45